ncbi:MAG TPA: putative zinc-binding metallopeptidase [Vicinamibacteria bacterium]|jgi:hypothetical protein
MTVRVPRPAPRFRATPAPLEPAEAAAAPSASLPWTDWDDERLLDVRLCDLGLHVEGSGLETRLAELHRELDARGITFRPHVWLSNEWFCPDGVPGIAVPFYLAHPRLMRLEQAQMLEVEGGDPEWCLRILRHETGHALENGYRLRRRKGRRALFGSTRQPYPDFYAPRPYSKSFVIHLDDWYAQSHPDEDFAETFAVWLAPTSDWRERYQGWPALRKLEYVDGLMAQIGPQPPPVHNPRTPEALPTLRETLREHYDRKRAHYGVDHPAFYDRDLQRLFSDDPQLGDRPTAASFIKRVGPEARRRVRRWTGVYQYTIDQVLKDMRKRCQELKLRLRGDDEQTRVEFTVLLTVQTMNYLHSGRHRVPL